MTEDTASTAARIACAAIDEAGRRGWSGLTMAAVAAEANVTLSELAALFPRKTEFLPAFGRVMDRQMLIGVAVTASSDESPRERLFDVIMRRFDAMAPHRTGLFAVRRDLPRDPLAALVLAGSLERSVVWMLEGAGLATGDVSEPLRRAAVGGAYLRTLRTWFDDESVDLAKTMATLDAQLRRAERVARFRGARSADGPAAPQTAPATDPEPGVG